MWFHLLTTEICNYYRSKIKKKNNKIKSKLCMNANILKTRILKTTWRHFYVLEKLSDLFPRIFWCYYKFDLCSWTTVILVLINYVPYWLFSRAVILNVQFFLLVEIQNIKTTFPKYLFKKCIWKLMNWARIPLICIPFLQCRLWI